MSRYTLIGAMLAVCFSSFPLASVSAPDDLWTEANGAGEATRVIDACLAHVPPSASPSTRDRCIREPLDACADRHARNEMTLAECTGFTREAWETMLKGEENRTRAAAPFLAKVLDETQGRWRVWSERDCAFQVGEEDGNYAAEQQNICLFTHAAQRALELRALADEWEDHPPSPPTVR
jgi:uncharacterized protein YecT (DUF1311 family)